MSDVLITYVQAVPARDGARQIRHAVSDFGVTDGELTEVRWVGLKSRRHWR
jgi:hypothetical protein